MPCTCVLSVSEYLCCQEITMREYEALREMDTVEEVETYLKLTGRWQVAVAGQSGIWSG